MSTRGIDIKYIQVSVVVKHNNYTELYYKIEIDSRRSFFLTLEI